MNQKFAVVCADGIGDALIFSIIAHNLRNQGHQVTVFSPHLKKFRRFLEKGEYLSPPKDWAKALKSFDAIILQNEDTPKAKKIALLRNENLPIFNIYTNYRLSKHGPLRLGFDYPVDEEKPMVENVTIALKELFGLKASFTNCLSPFRGLVHRKYKKRVLIHPLSTQEEKNWKASRFLKLARILKERGFKPQFIVSPAERKSWQTMGFTTLSFNNLEELGAAIYESGYLIGNDSGPAHIASYFEIPHIVICQGRQMPLWKPGWHPPRLILPPAWVPNFKGMRLREKRWKDFITVNQVLKVFSCL